MMRWVGAGLAVLCTGVLIVLHSTRPALPAPTSDCEAISDALLRQPGNALTALAIVAAGLIVALATNPPVTVLGIAGGLAGFGSFLAHATLHPVALLLDLIGIVLVVAAVLYVFVSLRPRWETLAPGGAVLAGGLVIWAVSRTGGPACAPEATITGHGAWHLAAAVALLVTARLVHREARQSA